MEATVLAIQVNPGTASTKKTDRSQFRHPTFFVHPKHRLGRRNRATADKRVAWGSHTRFSETDDFAS